MLSKKNKRQQFEQPIVERIFKILQAAFPAVVASCCLEFGVQAKKNSCLRWFYRQSNRQDLALSRIPDVVCPVSLILVFCEIVGKNLDVDLASTRTFCVPHHWISWDNNGFPTQIKVKFHIFTATYGHCATLPTWLCQQHPQTFFTRRQSFIFMTPCSARESWEGEFQIYPQFTNFDASEYRLWTVVDNFHHAGLTALPRLAAAFCTFPAAKNRHVERGQLLWGKKHK